MSLPSLLSFIPVLLLAATVGMAQAAPKAAVSKYSKQSAVEYGQVCADMIGQIPAFSCLDGTIVPITVDGKTPTGY